MLVTISGLPGSGTSTVAPKVAAALGLAHVDGGSVFRTVAREKGLTVAELSALAEADPSHDRALDERLADVAAAGDVVLESRLAGWIAGQEGLPALKVWVACDEQERARRVAGREGAPAEAALEQNREREASERTRYREWYGIDLTDLSAYDLVVDSTTAAPDELVARIVAAADDGSGDSRS